MLTDKSRRSDRTLASSRPSSVSDIRSGTSQYAHATMLRKKRRDVHTGDFLSIHRPFGLSDCACEQDARDLIEAVNAKDIFRVREIASNKPKAVNWQCSLDPSCFGETPVHVAARTGSLTILKALLDARGSPNARSWDQSRPLHAATVSNQLATVQHLVKLGAKDSTNRCGQTALWLAAEQGAAGAIATLLDEGDCRLDLANTCHNTSLGQLPCVVCGTDGLTAMHVAARGNHTLAVQAILERFGKQSVVLQSATLGETALHVAAEAGSLQAATMLLKAKLM